MTFELYFFNNLSMLSVEFGHLWQKEFVQESQEYWLNILSFFTRKPDGSGKQTTSMEWSVILVC